MIDLDRMAAEAKARLAEFINRSAAQQKRQLLESWWFDYDAPTPVAGQRERVL